MFGCVEKFFDPSVLWRNSIHRAPLTPKGANAHYVTSSVSSTGFMVNVTRLKFFEDYIGRWRIMPVAGVFHRQRISRNSRETKLL
jgi:hypothetical protein